MHEFVVVVVGSWVSACGGGSLGLGGFCGSLGFDASVLCDRDGVVCLLVFG